MACAQQQQQQHQHTDNDAELVLRITLLSLEGIVLSGGVGEDGSNNGNNNNNNANGRRRIVTAWAGFRSSSFPTKSMTVPSSHYSSLFHNNNNNNTGFDGSKATSESEGDEGCLIAVCSEEVKVDGNGDGGEHHSGTGIMESLEVHWQEPEKPTEKTTSESISTIPPQDYSSSQPWCANDEDGDEGVASVPHLEIKLPSCNAKEINIEPPAPAAEPPNAIEIHICIVCTSCVDMEISGDHPNSCVIDARDDDDSLSVEENARTNQCQFSRGIARLTLDENILSSTSDSICSYDREGGKVVILPIIRGKTPSSSSSSTPANALTIAHNSILSARVERIRRHLPREKKQLHYIESEWRGGENNENDNNNFAPASVIVNYDSNGNVLPSIEKGGGGEEVEVSGGLNKFFRHFSTLTMMGPSAKPALKQQPIIKSAAKALSENEVQQQQQHQKKDPMVGKVIEAVEYTKCPSPIEESCNVTCMSQKQQIATKNTAGATSSECNDCGMQTCLLYEQHNGNSLVCDCRKKNKKKKPSLRRLSSKQTASPTPQSQPPPTTPNKKTLSQKMTEKFVCGASLANVLGDAIAAAGKAGHHCDEDHVGLYVVDTEEYGSSCLGSSIATADLMGF